MSAIWQLSLSKTKGLLSYQHPVTFSNFDISQFLIMSLEESSGRIWTRDLEVMSLLGRPLEPTIFINKNLCRPVQSKNWGQFSEEIFLFFNDREKNMKQKTTLRKMIKCDLFGFAQNDFEAFIDLAQIKDKENFIRCRNFTRNGVKSRTTIWICYSNFELFW